MPEKTMMLSEYDSIYEFHGKSGTQVHRAWSGMRQRCTNPESPAYKYYGGRGIRVCEQWLRSFTAFYRRMGDPPTEKHTLDRINNNAGYAPMNCRWATYTQQANNRRPYSKKCEDDIKSALVKIRATKEYKAFVEARANEAGETVSQFVERAIEARIEGKG